MASGMARSLTDKGKVSKASVNYGEAPQDARRRCGTCSMFRPSDRKTWGSCTLVRGIIFAKDVCDKWEKK